MGHTTLHQSETHRAHTPAPVPKAAPLAVEVVDGPPLKPIVLEPEHTATFGRSADVAVHLDHHAVSRQHMAVLVRNGVWYALDLGSRNGTRLNGVTLPPGEPTPIADADHLQLGPWTLRLRIGSRPGTIAQTEDDAVSLPPSAQTTHHGTPGAQPRMSISALLRASAQLHAARNEGELLEALLGATQGATGFSRGAVLRRLNKVDQVEIVAQVNAGGRSGAPLQFSRSLIRAAAEGPVASMSTGSTMARMETLMKLDVAAAACAPIKLDEATWGYLYVDSASPSATFDVNEIVELLRVLADMASLALLQVKQREVRSRLDNLVRDVESAAEIQRILLPPPSGVIGRVSYAVRAKPGRMVSGDIFDVVDCGNGRTAVFLGDVMGKGLGAGLVMSAAQSFLHSQLPGCMDPAPVAAALNDYLCRRLTSQRFISMWIGLIDPARKELLYTDAGHGYGLLVHPGRPPQTLGSGDGLLLGISTDSAYASFRVPLGDLSRIVLFSDGVVEQPAPTGEFYGLDRLMTVLQSTDGPESDVAAIVTSVEQFAASAAPADDLTAASLRCDGR